MSEFLDTPQRNYDCYEYLRQYVIQQLVELLI